MDIPEKLDRIYEKVTDCSERLARLEEAQERTDDLGFQKRISTLEKDNAGNKASMSMVGACIAIFLSAMTHIRRFFVE